MTILSGVYQVPRGHRLYDALGRLLIVTDAMAIAIRTLMGSDIDLFGGDGIDFESLQFSVRVRIPCGAPLPAAMRNRPVNGFDIAILPVLPKSEIGPAVGGYRFDGVFGGIVGSTFVLLYEKYRPWIQANFSKENVNWPALFQFCWATRNALVHHEGAFNIENPKRSGVGWYHLSLSPADNGVSLVGDILSPADLLILAIEFSMELDRLGCPV